jgi:hypothetical protein
MGVIPQGLGDSEIEDVGGEKAEARSRDTPGVGWGARRADRRSEMPQEAAGELAPGWQVHLRNRGEGRTDGAAK